MADKGVQIEASLDEKGVFGKTSVGIHKLKELGLTAEKTSKNMNSWISRIVKLNGYITAIGTIAEAVVTVYDKLKSTQDQINRSTDVWIESNSRFKLSLDDTAQATKEQIAALERLEDAKKQAAVDSTREQIAQGYQHLAQQQRIIDAYNGHVMARPIDLMFVDAQDAAEATKRLQATKDTLLVLSDKFKKVAQAQSHSKPLILNQQKTLAPELVQINTDHANLLNELNQENEIAHEKSINAIIAKTNSPYENERLQANNWLATTQLGLDENAQGYQEYYNQATQLHEQWLISISTAEAQNNQKLAEQKLESAQNWQAGVSRATNDYYQSAADHATQFEELTKKGLNSMEDALVRFVTTGKLSFSDFTNSIIADLVRIQVRQNITSSLKGFNLTDIFSFFMPSAQSKGTTEYVVPDDYKNSRFIETDLLHTNDMADLTTSTMMAPESVFSQAERYHDGGILANEQAAILQKGEGTFTSKQMRALASTNATNTKAEVRVTVHNNTTTAQGRVAEQRQNQDGSVDLSIIIDEVDQALAGRIDEGNGELFHAIKERGFN